MRGFPGCTLAILAGGRGERLGGTVKARLRLPDGRSILERVEDELAPLFDELLVAGGSPSDFPDEKLVPDAYAGRGPAAGLHAALLAARTPWVLTLASDLPYATPALLSLLWYAREGAEAVVPDAGGAWQMQVAMWRREICLAAASALLETGAPGLRAIAASVKLATVPETALRELDASLRFLRTCNEPADLAELGLRIP